MRLNPLKCAFGVPTEKFIGFVVNERGANHDKVKALTFIKVLIALCKSI